MGETQPPPHVGHAGTHQAGCGKEAVRTGHATQALQALRSLKGDCAQGSPEACRHHRHLHTGPGGPGQASSPLGTGVWGAGVLQLAKG